VLGERGGSGVASPFLDALVEHWSCEESAGTRTGDFAGLVLNDLGFIPNTVGVIGNCASFTTGESLSIASTPELQTGNRPWTLAVWVKPFSIGSLQTIAHKGGSTAREFDLYIDGSGFATFRVFNGTGTTVVANTNASPPIAVGPWFLVVAGFDAVANHIFLSVNGGAFATDTPSSPPGANSETLEFGYRSFNATWPYVGRMDEIARWNRALPLSLVQAYYNSGNGLSWAAMQAYTA
jgi:hypothetical protein